MPLFVNAGELIRGNLQQFQSSVKIRVQAVAIGALTDVQLAAINANRAGEGLPPIIAEVLFVGWHIYKSRIIRDGYRIVDVFDQIANAMSVEAVVLDVEHMTAMENPTARADGYGNLVKDADGYGNLVKDRVVFECTARHPRPEFFSVVPKGDRIKPTT
ncbi:MAG: hypothetical protein WB562_11500 [Candidatus Sulfotelmatobacter sp.]